MATWRKLIQEEAEHTGDVFDFKDLYVSWGEPHDYYSWIHDDDETEEERQKSKSLDYEFDDGYGRSEGCPFLAWSKTRVYFPVTYDGAESVGSVPREPGPCYITHFGGE